MKRYFLLFLFLMMFFISQYVIFQFDFTPTVKAQESSLPSTVSSLTSLPIQFSETSDYVKLNFTMFVVEFYKGTTGYNKIYDKFGNVTVYDDRVVLEYWTGKGWKQRGTSIGVSYVKINDYCYNVTRRYDDYLGTTYNITYTVKSDSPVKIAINLKSGQTDTYRIAWHPSGIVKTDWKQVGNRLVFGNEAVDYGWIGFDWEDVYQSFGSITETSCEDVAQGKKANIYFGIGTVNAGQTVTVDPSVVGTSSTNIATQYPFQRKSFYANGRFWVFYSDGTNMVYSTSTDGSTWTTPATVRSASYGYTFSIWFDGTYLHYAYASSSSIYYRRGTPNSDGTITWSAAEQTVNTAYNYVAYPMVSVDSNGYVWIGYAEYTGSVYYPCVIKSGNNDGTWGTTPTGFPYQLSTSSSAFWLVSVIPLTSGKMLAVYAYIISATVKARVWTGSTWGTEVATTSATYYGYHHSVVAQGDDVHLVFLKSTGYDIIYVKYTYSTNSFGTETTLVTGTTLYSVPVISIDTSTNDLYVFAATKTTGTPSGWTANHIYYIKYTASTGQWGSWTDWIDESSEQLYSANTLTCFYQAYDNYIGLAYTTKTSSPYNVKFAFLNLNSPPNAPTLNSPAASYRFNPSANVAFSWTFSDNDTGDSQSAYQLQIGDSGFTTIYLDTNKVSSTAQNTTQTLPSNMTVGVYYWRVKTWDSQNAEGAWSSGRAIIVDRIKVDSFDYSGGTLTNMTFRLLSEYYSNTLNNTNLTLNVYLNDSLLDSISATSNDAGLVFVSLTHNICGNGTLTFNLTDSDGVVSYSYSCPVEVYVESIEVFSINPMILYTGDSLTITMYYKPKANINGTYISLSNVYWKALIYTDKYYGYYNFNLYNGSFANALESRVELMPIALSEGSYMLNMTFYIRGSDVFLGCATSPYFVVKSRPVTSGGAPSTVVRLPLTVVVRDYKGGYAQRIYVVVIDQYNATVWEGTTDNWGTAMTTLNPGTYNVTVRYDNETLSDTVTLSDEPVTKEFTLPGLAITPVTVTLDSYSILWLGIGLIGAIGAVILERKEKTAFAVALGLVTIGAVLHSLLVITHQMPPYFTVPPFDFSSFTKLPSFSLPSFSLPQVSLDMQTITLIAIGIIVPTVAAYAISQRGGTHKRRVRVGKFGEERRRRVWR